MIPDSPNAEIDYAVWSPTGAKIAYVYKHDIYVRDMAGGEIHRATFDGGTDVFNGVPDWVFEEEVFADRAGLWWSPDSSHIAYLRINESEVPVYSIPYYISNTYEPLSYPTFKDLKYPKAGYPNPIIDVWIYEIGDIAFQVIYPEPHERREDEWPSSLETRAGNETDGWGDKKLIMNVLWMGDTSVMLSETNRVSDHFRAVLVDVPNKSAQIVRDEKVEDGWFEIVPFPCPNQTPLHWILDLTVFFSRMISNISLLIRNGGDCLTDTLMWSIEMAIIISRTFLPQTQQPRNTSPADHGK